MSRSIRIGTVAGIGVFLHWTFLLLMAGLFGFYLWRGQSLTGALAGLGLITAAFVCVVLHELGHALAARRFDVPTRDITLYPIGGVARLQRMPEAPLKELWIAIAGPAVNVVLAGLLAGAVVVTGASWRPESVMRPAANPIGTLLWMNVALAAFNMLPAFPMDGGRVLRSLLALRGDYAKATKTAANIGQGMAFAFALVGLFYNPVLIFIAVFVYLGAQQESKQATLRTFTRGLTVRRAMMTRFATLGPDATLGDAVDALLAGAEHDFPVVDAEGRLTGLLSRRRLIEALAQHGRSAAVAAVAADACFATAPDAMLDDTFIRMREEGCSSVPVVEDDGTVVGLLTLENVGEFVMVASATGGEDVA
jgi:Zn-dependent protease